MADKEITTRIRIKHLLESDRGDISLAG